MTALLVSLVITGVISYKPLQGLDLNAGWTYQKALIVDSLDDASKGIRQLLNPSAKYYYTKIDAYSKRGLEGRDIDPRKIIKSGFYKSAYVQIWEFLQRRLLLIPLIMAGIFAIIYLLWSRFGKEVKSEKIKEGSAQVLTAAEVKRKLKAMDKCSNFAIGNMPLVKDSETRHFLVMGSTGSGKTNLLHYLLPQIKEHQQPALIIDQTGEMIARYYNPSRGDIIFNPFDLRSQNWDFWADCSTDHEIERFSKILFSFNRKRSRTNADPFWEQSAQYVFNACAGLLIQQKNYSLTALKELTIDATLDELRTKLKGTAAERYLTDDGKGVASSVLSMLATSARPISYLSENSINGSFSLKGHFNNIKAGSNAWLFFSTKPSSRELTFPLIACLSELALSRLMDIGIDQSRRVWCVFDELASLGNLPALSPLMAEGRKYGAAVIACLQSLNQLYDHYGSYAGSSIFGQFATCFFFRNTEPAIARMFSSMCGSETITRQQKNTSFGANEFRDGVSYQEVDQRKELVEYNELASLAVGECYTILPEPKVRISKMQVPQDKEKDITQGFIENN
jgi:type IV conjugative transfer system coupling protein TraD